MRSIDAAAVNASGPAHEDHSDAGAILLFDGDCNLCNGAVRFVLKRDPAGRVRFASLQSEAGRQLLAAHGQQPGESMVLIVNGALYTRSSAALRLAGFLRAPWPALKLALVVPPLLRDAIYDLVSRHRYRWFGRTNACRLPTPAEAARFVN